MNHSNARKNASSGVKDKFGAKSSLRHEIKKKYELIAVIGKGEYGCVSKAKCLTTGELVALKIVENHDNTEYDIIKVIREISLLRRLNYLQNMLGVKKD